MNEPRVLISPDGQLVALHRMDGGHATWHVSNGGRYHDIHVKDWRPMVLKPDPKPETIESIMDEWDREDSAYLRGEE